MILVGATNQFGNEALFLQTVDFVNTFAAGDILNAPGSSGNSDYEVARGTSFAAPQVAALAAYFKALPSKWQGQREYLAFIISLLLRPCLVSLIMCVIVLERKHKRSIDVIY